ncbi:peroxidase 49-like [Prosopis cineraria]|uniref:peroxidase 49-like n=1 Tax=Prosopis cineraria TaxID=364024 RepID=UPI00240EC263|nr:peroxidase 49-like [Prosopis cineraria]
MPNKNLAHSDKVIDAIKSEVEKDCPDIVFCANILTVAIKDSVHLLRRRDYSSEGLTLPVNRNNLRATTLLAVRIEDREGRRRMHGGERGKVGRRDSREGDGERERRDRDLLMMPYWRFRLQLL